MEFGPRELLLFCAGTSQIQRPRLGFKVFTQIFGILDDIVVMDKLIKKKKKKVVMDKMI